MRLFCVVPLALALATLTEVEDGRDTLRPGATPKVSKLTVLKVLTEARAAVRDNDSLDRMLAQYRPRHVSQTKHPAMDPPRLQPPVANL